MSTTLILAVSGRDEVALVHAFSDPALRVTVVRRCADLAEVLAAAQVRAGEVALIDLELRGLDRDAVEVIRRAGTAVVAFAHRPDQAVLAEGLGIERTVLAGEDAAVVADAVAQELDAARDGSTRRPAGRPRPAPDASGDGGGGAAAARPTGELVAIWSPVGSHGASSLAVNLAAECAAAGAETTLVDADTYGASLAQQLGVLDEAPGLIAAVRAASHGTLDAAGLAGFAPFALDGVRLLTGISTPSRWPEIRQSAFERVLEVARELAPLTVVDTGFGLEDDEELSYDTLAPRRNLATRCALEAADRVIVTVGADPVAATRLLKVHDELLEAVRAPITLVLNRIRSASAATEMMRIIHRHTGLEDIRSVPEDTTAFDRALWNGATLRETAPRSPARRSIAQLAADLVVELAPRTAPPAQSAVA